MIRTILAIVGVILAGGIFFYYTKPAYDQVQESQATILQFNNALSKANELQKLKQSLLSRYNSFDPTSLDRLQKLLPDHVDNIGLILDLDNLAGTHGMALANVDVSSSAIAKGSNATAIGNTGEKFESLTLRFSTQTTYANFLAFLQDLESSLRIVDLDSMSISSESSTGGYKFDVTIRTYWLK